MKLTKPVSILGTFIVWIPIIFFSLLLAHNAVLYFTHGGEYGILPEKIVAREDLLWNIAFYVHLPTGIICLLTPLILFSRIYFKGLPALHRKVGVFYVWITLVLVCPTGMYLALYAKGGAITQLGFMMQGILLARFTYKGYVAITRKHNSIEHRDYMIRSYSMVAVVLSFRIFHIVFFLLNVPYQDNYAIAQWLGLSANLLLAEIFIAVMSGKTKNQQTFKSKIYEII